MSARFDPTINGDPPPIVVFGPPNDPIASNGGRDSPDEVKSACIVVPPPPRDTSIHSSSSFNLSQSHGIQETDTVRMPVLMAGTLQKMGRRLKRWTPRYFELQGSKLHYYKTPSVSAEARRSV